MSRKPPSDTFTRFTSATPHASQSTNPASSRQQRQPAPSSQSQSSQRSPYPPGPEGETPAQKVARLRAASRLAKERGSLSPVDRLVARGRFWADVAHRFTTYGLLAFTGISSVVAVYGLVSLVSHNRRQKRAWIEREMDRLHQAQQAFLRGEADAEQLHLLEQERAGEEMAKQFKADKERRKTEGMWGRVKGTFGSFTSQGDRGLEDLKSVGVESLADLQHQASGRDKLLSEGWVDGEVDLQPAAVQETNIAGVGLDEKGRPVPINKVQRVTKRVEDERRTGEREVTQRTGITGGPLDVLAGNVASVIVPHSQNNQGWFSWISGSKPSS